MGQLYLEFNKKGLEKKLDLLLKIAKEKNGDMEETFIEFADGYIKGEMDLPVFLQAIHVSMTISGGILNSIVHYQELLKGILKVKEYMINNNKDLDKIVNIYELLIYIYYNINSSNEVIKLSHELFKLDNKNRVALFHLVSNGEKIDYVKGLIGHIDKPIEKIIDDLSWKIDEPIMDENIEWACILHNIINYELKDIDMPVILEEIKHEIVTRTDRNLQNEINNVDKNDYQKESEKLFEELEELYKTDSLSIYEYFGIREKIYLLNKRFQDICLNYGFAADEKLLGEKLHKYIDKYVNKFNKETILSKMDEAIDIYKYLIKIIEPHRNYIQYFYKKYGHDKIKYMYLWNYQYYSIKYADLIIFEYNLKDICCSRLIISPNKNASDTMMYELTKLVCNRTLVITYNIPIIDYAKYLLESPITAAIKYRYEGFDSLDYYCQRNDNLNQIIKLAREHELTDELLCVLIGVKNDCIPKIDVLDEGRNIISILENTEVATRIKVLVILINDIVFRYSELYYRKSLEMQEKEWSEILEKTSEYPLSFIIDDSVKVKNVKPLTSIYDIITAPRKEDIITRLFDYIKNADGYDNGKTIRINNNKYIVKANKEPKWSGKPVKLNYKEKEYTLTYHFETSAKLQYRKNVEPETDNRGRHIKRFPKNENWIAINQIRDTLAHRVNQHFSDVNESVRTTKDAREFIEANFTSILECLFNVIKENNLLSDEKFDSEDF